LLAAIRELLARKQIAPEMGLSQPVAIINSFIEDELNRLDTMNPQRSEKQEPLSKLNALFQSVLRESA
jgi:uncharacterized protein